jgi:murein L,D-transpeptidase YcbB/YkuD
MLYENVIRCVIAAAVAIGPSVALGESTLTLAAATTQPGGAMDAALREQLRPGRADDAAIARFYAAEGNQPFWTAARGAALAQSLRAAPTHALPAPNPNLLAAAERAASDPALDLALTRAFLDHARRMTSGVLDPRRVDPMIKRVAPVWPADALLDGLLTTSDIGAYLDRLVPQDPDYRQLQAAFEAARAVPAEDWGSPLAAGPTLRLGDRGPRVLQLRQHLERLNAAPVGTPADATVFDTALDAAIRRFQAAHGLNTDGAVGPVTRGALNTGPAERIRKLAVNLERRRWTNMPLGATHIIVNQPDFRVQMVEDGRVVFDERVVIGRRDRQTPEFSDVMEHLVFNPTWFVPRSIATKDILPKLHEDPGYLARSNMLLTRSDGGPVPLATAEHDFTVYTASDFPYRIRQRPDPGNALGQVKFMFPNNHAIYLHDTPSRNLFLRDRRTFSSGCVRVRDPMRLAALLLAPQVAEPDAYIERLLAGGRERYVHLDRPVPVHLTYRTAVIDETGTIQFRADIYGRDDAVADALRDAGVRF